MNVRNKYKIHIAHKHLYKYNMHFREKSPFISNPSDVRQKKIGSRMGVAHHELK